MRFYAFHLMPWPHLPDDFAADPRHRLGGLRERRCTTPSARPRGLQPLPRRARAGRPARLRRRLRQRAPPERLRPDAVAEHHGRLPGAAHQPRQAGHPGQRADALRPSAARGRGDRHARRDQRRAASSPARWSGTGNEFFSYNVNPTYARERFREAHELIMQGVDRARAVRLGGQALPLPLRQRLAASRSSSRTRPSGSRARARARRSSGWPSSATRTWCCRRWRPTRCARQTAEYVPRGVRARRLHGPPRRRSAGASASTWPRPTPRRSRSTSRTSGTTPRTCSRTATRSTRRPGTRRSTLGAGHAGARGARSRPGNFSTWEEIQKAGYVVVGSPATVRDRLQRDRRATGLGTLVPNFSVGNVPHQLTRKSMELFATRGHAGAARASTSTPSRSTRRRDARMSAERTPDASAAARRACSRRRRAAARLAARHARQPLDARPRRGSSRALPVAGAVAARRRGLDHPGRASTRRRTWSSGCWTC